jgi:hypothetical protein
MERCAGLISRRSFDIGHKSNMGETRKAEFCKNEECPSSQELFAFQNGDISVEDGRHIRVHLRTCEFCTAETEFYEHYPQQAEVTEAGRIPQPLFELAAALLKKDHDDFLVINDLID